jgi:DNA-binding NarL/FixJ family response regulator
MTRILIADDHPLVRTAVKYALEAAIDGIDLIECGTIAGAHDQLDRDPDIDLVLLDLDLPDASDLSGVIQLLGQHPTTPIVILSAKTDPVLVRRAVAAGVAGYIPKMSSMGELVRIIGLVLDGERWWPELGEADDEEAQLVAGLSELTSQQLRILALVMAGKLNKQIANDLAISEQTVKVHVSTILRKLRAVSRTQAAMLAGQAIARGLWSPPE